jgi:hypothetical protein
MGRNRCRVPSFIVSRCCFAVSCNSESKLNTSLREEECIGPSCEIVLSYDESRKSDESFIVAGGPQVVSACDCQRQGPRPRWDWRHWLL